MYEDEEIPLHHSGLRRRKMRKWEVVDGSNKKHVVEAHFMFNNGDEGIIFRYYPPDASRTEVVAMFANGNWKFVKEITNG